MSAGNDYFAYSAASGTAAATIAISAATEAASIASGNWSDLSRITWDSWVRAMASPVLGYPTQAIQNILNVAWPFLPNNIRTQLSKREAPGATKPSLPNPDQPVIKHEATKQIPSSVWTAKNIAIGAGVAGGALLLWKLLSRPSKERLMRKGLFARKPLWTPPPAPGPWSSVPIGKMTIGTLASLSIGLKNDPNLPSQTETERAAEWARYVAAHPDLYNPDGTLKAAPTTPTTPTTQTPLNLDLPQIRRDLSAYQAYVRSLSGDPANSLMVEIMKRAINSNGTAQTTTNAEVGAKQNDVAEFSAWITDVLHGDPAYSSAYALGQRILAGFVSAGGNWTSPGGTQPGPDPFAGMGEGMSTKTKVLLGAGALGAAGLIYTIFRGRRSS